MPEKDEKEILNELYTHLIGVNGEPGALEQIRDDIQRIADRQDKQSLKLRQHDIAVATIGGVLIGLGIIQFVPL